MKQQDIFDSLARNAFDFLKRAMVEFDKDPKFSVIHFCAAVEMLLKARLLKEHWSLLVSKQEPVYSKFLSGDFTSVTMEESRARIRDVANDDIGEDAFSTFKGLTIHRNKLIHFFHADMETNEDAKARIVAEHCRSWFYLHRLLIKWNDHFRGFSKEIALADAAMKRHQKYLNAKFKALKSELDTARARGDKPRKCNACALKAAVPDSIDEEIADVHCLVCDHTETQVQMDCPDCHVPTFLVNEGWGHCHKCGYSIEPKDVATALVHPGADYLYLKDGDDDYAPANCSHCDGYHTVVKRDARFFCCSCFEWFDSTQQCQWCYEMNTGDMEDSYLLGCNQCDGNTKYLKDE